jgi:hypothetical protein
MHVVAPAIEIAVALVSVGGLAYIAVTLPDGPIAGPGAVGLLFIIADPGLLTLAGSLIHAL